MILECELAVGILDCRYYSFFDGMLIKKSYINFLLKKIQEFFAKPIQSWDFFLNLLLIFSFLL